MSYLRYLCLWRNVCSMLPISLDCPYLIAPSILSNGYLIMRVFIILSNHSNENCVFLLLLIPVYYWAFQNIGSHKTRLITSVFTVMCA